MQVFSTWGPLLSTSLAIYKAFRANISAFVSYVMYCDLCLISRVYAQFNFLLQGKCCSATVGKLPLCCISLSFVLYLEKFYN